jgi:hypothetical protein
VLPAAVVVPEPPKPAPAAGSQEIPVASPSRPWPTSLLIGGSVVLLFCSVVLVFVLRNWTNKGGTTGIPDAKRGGPTIVAGIPVETTDAAPLTALDEEAATTAIKLWKLNRHGESLYFCFRDSTGYKFNDVLHEVRDASLAVQAMPLNPADRLNGRQWSGSVYLRFIGRNNLFNETDINAGKPTFYRDIRNFGSYSEWTNNCELQIDLDKRHDTGWSYRYSRVSSNNQWVNNISSFFETDISKIHK